MTHLRSFSNFLRPLAVAIVFVSTAGAQIPKYNSYSAAPATIYLDFDGETVEGTSWNWDSTIHARPANLSTAIITEVFNRVSEDYRIFKLNITTDPAVYANAPVDKRQRVIVTPTSNWYGIAGGVSFVNSFVWGDGTPSWVFTDQLQNNAKYIAEATAHEIGHTLGLQHQSDYDQNCNLVSEYGQGHGTGEIGWAPIMGEGYYQNQTTWHNGHSIIGCDVAQDDIDIIANGMNDIGFKADDYGNSFQNAYNVPVSNPNFQIGGLISSANDIDVFKVVLVRSGRLKAQVIPNNVAAGNSGANVDLQVSLVKANGDTIGRYNPKTLLNATLDTTLQAGIYYMVVDGVGNAYAKNYGSVGYYFIYGSLVLSPVAVVHITLKGALEMNVHAFKWSVDGSPAMTEGVIETSYDGATFSPISSSIVAPVVNSYRYYPNKSGQLYYRVRLTDAAREVYYSNVVVLENNGRNAPVTSLLSTVIRGTATVKVGSNHNYQLFDETGRLMQEGQLSSGTNNIAVNTFKKGLLLLKLSDGRKQTVFKLINQ